MNSNQISAVKGKTYPKTFTAIDFEIATTKNERQICQIGMTVVKNGEIADIVSVMVRPYLNQYDEILTGIHGINPLMTENSQDFRTVWEKLSKYIVGPLVAHNASFDRSVLSSNLDFYGMDYDVPSFEDTRDIFNGSIDLILKYLGMDSSMHHNAEFDSRIAAELMLAASGLGSFADGIDPEDLEAYRNEYFKIYGRKSQSSLYAAKVISKEYKMKDTENCKDKNNMFFDKTIVITGDFPIFRNDLAKKIHEMGARITSSISGKTNFVLVGYNPGPSKLMKIEELQSSGSDIQIVNIDELKKMNLF